tara:strand:+ start:616 stop:819 length:204 start_codon:yes stop_codon:yes gene_type:complete
MKYHNGQLVEDTAEDLAQIEADKVQAPISAAEDKAKEDEAKALKASAKAKLIAGEALTEEEADTIVL